MASFSSLGLMAAAGLGLCHGVSLRPMEGPQWGDVYHSEPLPAIPKECPKPFANASSGNICISGHAAPELFILGAQRAATISFALMVNCPQMVWAEPKENEPGYYGKELHFFDKDDRFHKGKDFWLSHYPTCNDTVRTIAVDDTPNYMFTDVAEKASQRISSIYGEWAPMIKFVAILREPLTRAQSAFHYFVDMAWHKEETSRGFQYYVQQYIDNASDPCQFFKDSDYTTQLKPYFKQFQFAQFTIVPFQDLAAEGNTTGDVIKSVWQSLGYNAEVVQAPQLVYANRNPHPSLKEELDKATREKARWVVGQTYKVEDLADLLARGTPILPTYAGDPQNSKRIAAWISSRW